MNCYRGAFLLLFLVGAALSASNRQQRPKETQKQTQSDDSDLTDECPEPNGYFADGYQCDKYYECIDGAITEKLCPDGMVFNDYSVQVEKCDLPFNIDCSQRPQLQEPKPTTHCRRLNGYFEHEDPKVCDKFYFCVDGKFNMITCPAGLVYNEKSGICTWPDEAKKKHCSSEADKNRVKRVAFWKSEEDMSGSGSAERTGGYSGSVEDYDGPSSSSGSRERKKSGEDYDYPMSGPVSYEEGYVDPEFADFDSEFDSFANKPVSFGDYFGMEMMRRMRRRDDSAEQDYSDFGSLDDYIGAYVKTIGNEPKDYESVDNSFYERLAEEAVGNSGKSVERHRRGPDFAESQPKTQTKAKPEPNPSPSPPSPEVPKQIAPPPETVLKRPHASVLKVLHPQVIRHTVTQPKAMALGTGVAVVPFQRGPVPVSSVPTLYRTLVPPVPRCTEVFRFDCPKVDMTRAQQHPRYPDPEDCQFFYVCINGETPRRNGCKKGQVFNEATGSCDWPRNVPECKDWYKGILTDEELYALEHPQPKVRNSTYTAAAARRKHRPSDSS